MIIIFFLFEKWQGSAVQLSNVLYQNIRGTSASEVAIKFDCSRTIPCREIYLQDVILKPQGTGGTSATCDNVRFLNRGSFFPQCTPWRTEEENKISVIGFWKITKYKLYSELLANEIKFEKIGKTSHPIFSSVIQFV